MITMMMMTKMTAIITDYDNYNEDEGDNNDDDKPG